MWGGQVGTLPSPPCGEVRWGRFPPHHVGRSGGDASLPTMWGGQVGTLPSPPCGEVRWGRFPPHHVGRSGGDASLPTMWGGQVGTLALAITLQKVASLLVLIG